MNVLKNYFYNASYQLFKVIVPLFTIPYLSRVLGPKGIGIDSYTNSIIQFFILIGDLGITMYGDRKIAYVRNNRYKLTQTFFEIAILQICTLTISYFLFFIFLMFTNQYHYFYLAQSLFIIANAFDISWFFMGVENFRVTVLRNFIIKILIIICIFVFVKSYSDLLLYIILYGSSFIIGDISLYPALRKYINLPDFKELHIIKHILPSIALFIPTVATQIYLPLNKSMLGIFEKTEDAGYYNQSDKVIEVILAIVTATGTVMLPHVANAYASGKRKATKQYLYDSFSLVTSLSMAMSFGLSSIAPSFVPIFFGYKFLIVSPLIMIQSLVIIFMAWNNAIGVQYLLPTKQTKQYTISVVIGSLVNVMVNIPLILQFGVIGSIIGTVIAELSITSYQLFAVKDQISLKFLFKDCYKYLLSGTIMFLVIFILNIHFYPSWYLILLDILLGTLIYLILIFVMRANIFQILHKMINSNY